MDKIPARILPIIVFSQFTGTSLWFAGNAVLGDLQQQWDLPAGALGYLTSAVQFGFIVGTLTFAFTALSDKVSPRVLFLACSLLGAFSNLMIYLAASGLVSLVVLRFVTGFFLAGIYPIGMKIATGWYAKSLGKAIGFLVGALVLGTAFPHLIKSFGGTLPWQSVILIVSGVAVSGGILMFLGVPDGPHLPKKPAVFDPAALPGLFRSRDFRAASFGYFGHMWELYAFWAFLPVALQTWKTAHGADLNVSLWAFILIAVGFMGCSIGGLLSQTKGSAPVAFTQLLISGLCCLLSPLLLQAPFFVLIAFLFVWGVTVIGDSPQFSALTAQTAPRERVGSALTIVNCIGFSITIFSIQLLDWLSREIPPQYIFLFLAPGPVFGLLAVKRLVHKA